MPLGDPRLRYSSYAVLQFVFVVLLVWACHSYTLQVASLQIQQLSHLERDCSVSLTYALLVEPAYPGFVFSSWDLERDTKNPILSVDIRTLWPQNPKDG